jgi:hypothetical protein
MLTVTRVEGGRVSVGAAESASSPNPSTRRDGLSIEFGCENCGDSKTHLLRIAQHKGETEISWLIDNAGK